MTYTSQHFAADERTVVSVLRRNAEIRGNDCAIRMVNGDSISYAALDERSTRLAGHFRALGIDRGDTVLIMLPDCIEYIVIFAALAKIGAIEVPVNTAYRGALLAHVVNDSAARTAIVADTLLERWESIAERIVSLEQVLLFPAGPQAELETVRGIRRGCAVEPYFGLYDGPSASWSGDPSPEDLLAIMYTSGTTGPSKGVMVSNAYAFEFARGDSLVFGTTPSDRVYTAGLPLFHNTGQWALTYASFIVGATVVMRQRFSKSRFWSDVHAHHCTATMLLGAISNFLWQEPVRPDDGDNPLEKVFMAPLLLEHRGFAERFGVRICTTFAMTETAPICVGRFDDPTIDYRCVGTIRNDEFEVAIVDETDQPVPAGSSGEIVIRPKRPGLMMSGYWKRPEATVEAWRNLWFHTGDAGYMDEQNRLHYADRLKDTIRRRGENISSLEVEAQVSRFPGVAECAVYPVKDQYADEEVAVAVVSAENESPVDAEALVRFVNERLPYFMVPRYVLNLPALPKTQTGKTSKVELKSGGIVTEMWDRVMAGVELKR